MFYIDFGTGVGNIEFFGELEDALDVADDNAAYTQQDICITDDDGDCWVRFWVSIPWSKDTGFAKDEIINYGKFGYYAPWEYQF